MLRNWRRSAAYRIGFAWAGAFAAGTAVLGLLVFVAMHLAFRQQIDAMISEEADALSAEYHNDGLDELRSAIVERETNRPPNRMMYAIYDSAGRRVTGTAVIEGVTAGTHDVTFVDPVEGPDKGRATVRPLGPNVTLVVVADREWLERIDAMVVGLFGAAFLGVLLLGSLGGAVLGRYLRRRLQSISEGAQAIIGGDTRQRMHVSPRGDEFDQVAIVLNRMLNRIDMLIENLRQVSSDIAHDLRTPLTRLRNYLERNGPDPEFSTGAIGRVDELLALFAAILRIAEVEGGETKRFFGPVDLTRLVLELAESYQPSVSESGRELLWHAEPSVSVLGDAQLLAQAIANLLDNAIRHTQARSIIRLTLTTGPGRAIVSVTDNGKGIPKSERSRVVRRFQRLDQSRSTPGFGLGLNLSSAVAALHDGILTLGDARPGLEARLDLPLLTRHLMENANDEIGR